MTRLSRNAARLAVLALTVGGPAACTSDNPGTPGPDAGAQPDAGHVADANPPDFAVESSVPANGARGVSIWSAAEIRLSGTIDPTNLDPRGIQLTYGVWEPRDVITDAMDQTLTVQPTQPLVHGTRYELRLAGVTNTEGQALDDTIIAFTTFVNPKTREDRREGGNVFFWTAYENNADGRIARRIEYGGRGPDDQWFTADDRVEGYTVHAYQPAAPVTGSATYADAGADGKWFTSDDELSALRHVETNDDGLVVRVVNHDSAGPDGLPFTGDDTVRDYQVWTHTKETTVTVSVASPGPDGRWHTSDDVPRFHERTEYDPQRRPLSRARFDGAGEDGVWKTNDDRPAFLYTYVYTDGESRTIYRAGATSRVQWYSDKQRLANGENIDVYQNPGPDDVWFTADDVRATHDRVEKRSGRVMQATRFGEDRSITRILSYDYEPHGSRTRSVEYSGAGYDEAWGTSDDVVKTYVTTSYDDRGNRLQDRQYDGPGEDKLWFTDDDQLSSETTHDPNL